MGDRMVAMMTWRQQYNAYMQTQQWAAMSKRVIQRDGKCLRCGEGGRLEAHHLTYERLMHEDLRDLVTLCHDCHQTFHRHRRREPMSLRTDVTMAEATLAFIRDVGAERYPAVVMADHTPPVAPASARADGKRTVDLSRRARKQRGGDPKSLGKTAVQARAERWRWIRDYGL